MSTIDPLELNAVDQAAPQANRALAVRYWAGFVSVPAAFASMLVAVLLVGAAGDGAPSAELAAFARGGAASAVPFLELANAAALIGLAAFFGTSIRGRGSWLATLGIGATFLGALGSTMVAMRHFYDLALASAPQAVSLSVLRSLDTVMGPLPLLLTSLAPTVGVVLLAIAAFRAGGASIIALALALAYAVLEYTPLPESVGILVGGVAFTWIAVRMVRMRRRA